ncbi:methyltransferase domain-containing protein [Qipengyuania nanhaisediminis]|uniref:methyltransferase domain-containing protein n=1 Tax=Qipengyuania nanhaisediminis TaxID=604088 RepID=UPI0038B385EC
MLAASDGTSACSPPLPAEARAVPMLPAMAVFLRSIGVDAIHRLVKRRSRDRAQVAHDYESGDWRREQREAVWRRNPTLIDYADRAHLDRAMQVTVDGKLVTMPAPSYYRFRRHKLASIMEEFASDTTQLVELGSGTGGIVFELASSLPDKTFVGLDLSPRGIAVARTVAEYYGLDRASFDFIDLLDPDSQGYRKLEGQTVYSHYCLEQLPRETEAIFRNIVAAGARRAILIEPSFELLDLTRLSDLATWSYVLRQDYQRSILRTARKLESEGLIRIRAARRLDFVSSHRNCGTLLVFDRA